MNSTRPISVDDIASRPEVGDLLDAYGRESSIPELGEYNPQWEAYRQMERAGILHAFGAFDGDRLVGFLTMVGSILPHYGRRVFVTESYFVAPEARRTGAGLDLLRAAEQWARAEGAAALLVSAPTGGVLEAVLPGVDYRHTNSVFMKALA